MTDAPEPRKPASAISDQEFQHAVLDRLDSFSTRLTGLEAFAFRSGLDLAEIKERMGTFEANQERDHNELMKLVRKDERGPKA